MQQSDTPQAITATPNVEADGHSASLCTEASSMSVTPSSTTTQPATTSFRDLLPVPHRARPSSTRAVRKKPPTPELTSDESLKFVTEVLDKQKSNRKDDWECCKNCKRWWHETCAALSGTFSNRNVFSCDQCVYGKKKKLS